MNKLKVGIFTEVYHPTMNGVVVSIDTFRSELAKLGVECIVFAPQTKGAAPEQNVVRFPSLPIHSDYPLPLAWLASQYRQIARYRLDLIHTQHPFAMGWFGLFAARRLNIPIVTTYHTLLTGYVRVHAGWLPFGRGLMHWLTTAYCNRVDLVIVPSPAMRSVLQSYEVATPIEVNPTGIFLEQFRDPETDIKQVFGIPQHRRVLLYVGRLGEEKNIRMMLIAVSMVRHTIPDVHLLLVGSGPERRTYEQLVKRIGLDGHVTFAGFLPKEETNRLFGGADIFIFPSTTDTQGIVIMEAMATGTPIVAVDALGPGDIIEDGQTGLLTDNDAADFSLAIARLLQNRRLAATLGTNAKKAAPKYSAHQTAKRQLTLYRALLTHKSFHQIRPAYPR